MNKLKYFLSFFVLTVLSVSGGIGVASISYSDFEGRLNELAFLPQNNEYQGKVAGANITAPKIIPAGEEYAMLVTVVNAVTAPVCNSLLSDIVSGVAPLDVKFTGSGQGDFLSYKFIFGDGEQVTTLDSQTIHTYLTPGKYNASLKVISNKTESDSNDSCKTIINVSKKQEVQNAEPIVTKVSHLVCRNLACLRVSGEGEDECSSNVDCSVATAPVSSVDELGQKPLVPVTGDSQLAIYFAMALGFISAGLILFIFI